MTIALKKPLIFVLIATPFSLLPTLVAGQPHAATAAHADPVTPLVLALAIILAAAKFGGSFAK